MCQCTDWLSATSSGTRIGGGVIALEFVSPLIPIRLRVVLALPARRPGLPRTVRGGAARCAAPVTALLGPLAGCPRLCPAWAVLVAPVVSTLGGSWPPVAPAVSVLLAAHRPSVAPAVSTPDYAARRKSVSPAVSTSRSAHMPLVAPKVSSASSSTTVAWYLPPGAYCTVISKSGRAEPPFLRVDGLVAYVCRA